MKALGVVFSNIYDSSLGELTNHRTVASLPFGGRYRQIDFVLSNMSKSDIHNIGVITKYNYRSLMDHLGSCADWDLNRKNAGLTILPPFASGNTIVYKGKMEALYSAVHFIDEKDFDYVVLSDSNVLCTIDYKPAIEKHIKSGCDVTIITAGDHADRKENHHLVVNTDKKGKVQEILVDAPYQKDSFVGIGMFIIKRELLVKAINECYQKGLVHFERDFIQRGFNEKKLSVNVYEYGGIVLRNDDVQSYFKNNMLLLTKRIRDGLFNAKHPLYTKVRDEIPSKYNKGCSVKNCLVADGCELSGEISNSILFRGVKLENGAKVNNCIVMQGTKIGKNASLDYVILDKNVTVKDGTVLKGTADHAVIVKKGETV